MSELAGGLLFIVLGVLALAGFIFWIWMLVDCATKEPEGNDKLVWILIIILTHVIGALIYFLVSRPKRWELAHR